MGFSPGGGGGTWGSARPGEDFVGEGFVARDGRAGLGLFGATDLLGDSGFGGAALTGDSLGGSEGGSSTGETDLTVLTLALDERESLLDVRLSL